MSTQTTIITMNIYPDLFTERNRSLRKKYYKTNPFYKCRKLLFRKYLQENYSGAWRQKQTHLNPFSCADDHLSRRSRGLNSHARQRICQSPNPCPANCLDGQAFGVSH